MLPKPEYIRTSVEVNLFFQRIMKEHLFLLEVNLQPAANPYIVRANELKRRFEHLLENTLHYSDKVVSERVISSKELVTPYTLRSEEVTSKLTGAGINTSITKRELALSGSSRFYGSELLLDAVNKINNGSYLLLQETISFQKDLLTKALHCKVFMGLYPEMLEHDIREAGHYLKLLTDLLDFQLPRRTLCEDLNFWNNIMEEHARFIDGMLDPTEMLLKDTARASAQGFEKLLNACISGAEYAVYQSSLSATEEIKDFKLHTTEGLLTCKIKSIIPPLLADHVLREANHYLRLLDIQRA